MTRVCLVLFGLAIGLQLQSGQAQDARTVRVEVDRIVKGIRDRHIFSAADKRYAIQLSSGSFASQAFLVLKIAMDNRLYAQSDLLSLIEKRATSASPAIASQCAGLYAIALDVGQAADPATLQKMFTLEQGQSANRIAPDERRFVLSILRDGLGNRLLAGHVLVRKKGLPQSDRAWASSLVGKESAKSSGAVKHYWDFVIRVVRARNQRR